MRYYDPIIGIIQENSTQITRDYFNLKNSVAVACHKDGDFKTRILEKLGLIGDDKDKMSYKFNAVNKKAPYEINYNESVHALTL